MEPAGLRQWQNEKEELPACAPWNEEFCAILNSMAMRPTQGSHHSGRQNNYSIPQRYLVVIPDVPSMNMLCDVAKGNYSCK